MCSDERVRDVAARFRWAIEQLERSRLGVSFMQFPLGSCGQVTPVLGQYLCDNGCGIFDYMLGERPAERPDANAKSHAWAQRGSLVVDLTADQFTEITEPVLVVRDSVWHAAWNGAPQGAALCNVYDASANAELMNLYRTIAEQANAWQH